MCIRDSKNDTDLGDDVGLLGDPFQPARDFLNTTFQAYLNPSFTLPAGAQCPVVTVDLPKLLGASIGRPGASHPVNNEFVCDWLEDQRAMFVVVLHMVWLIGGFVIVMRNS